MSQGSGSRSISRHCNALGMCSSAAALGFSPSSDLPNSSNSVDFAASAIPALYFVVFRGVFFNQTPKFQQQFEIKPDPWLPWGKSRDLVLRKFLLPSVISCQPLPYLHRAQRVWGVPWSPHPKKSRVFPELGGPGGSGIGEFLNAGALFFPQLGSKKTLPAPRAPGTRR